MIRYNNKKYDYVKVWEDEHTLTNTETKSKHMLAEEIHFNYYWELILHNVRKYRIENSTPDPNHVDRIVPVGFEGITIKIK